MPDIANAIVPVTPDVVGLGNQPCVNLAGDGTCADLYGHGTFMAGIIAGNGSASGGKYVGMAPGAGIVSVKVAGATGASDVSTLIAALQWVVQNKTAYNIRVLNLSLGTDSTQSYTIDPLDFAGRGLTASVGLAKPDVVAPGAHIVSLAAPGAAITTQFPSTMAAPYRRGSGTSMATAVVSGLEAQMLSLQPTATPDRVKYEL